MKWTEFPTVKAGRKTEHIHTWPELLEYVRGAGPFPGKASCPLLSLATYGTQRTGKESTRSAANVLAVHGVEGDYDAGAVTMAEAVAALERHGIRAAVYPSPSATAEKPRWRVLAPLATPCTPSERERMVARLNGALGGILAGESFALSQSFYFGKVGDGWDVLCTFDDPNDGTCIDELDELDNIAISRATTPQKTTDSGSGERLAIGAEMFHAAVRERGRLLKSGDGRRELLKSFIASRSARGMPPGDIRMMVHGIAAEFFDSSDPLDEANIAEIAQHFSEKDRVPTVDFSALLAQSKAANGPRYRLLGWPELETLPPIRWRVRGILPSTGVAAIYGPSKSGKSFLSFDMACAIAEGRDWFGYRTTPADVVLVCLEGEAGYKLRAQAWMQHHGRALPERLRLVMQPWKVTEPQDVADLAAVVPAGAVVFVDTMNRASPNTDENSSKDMGQIIEGTKALQSLTGGLAVLVAHTGKDTTKGLRGHSSLIAALDGAIETTRDTRDGDRRTWTADKVKDGQDGAVHPFKLEVLELGHDEDGEPLTSCAVSVGSDEQASNWPKPLTERQSAGMQSFYRAALEHGQESDDGQSISVHLEQWRPEFYKTCTADDQDAKKKAFQRVRTDLMNLGRLSLEHDNYRCPASDMGLIAARLIASADTGTRDRDGTEPGHVPVSHPL